MTALVLVLLVAWLAAAQYSEGKRLDEMEGQTLRRKTDGAK